MKQKILISMLVFFTLSGCQRIDQFESNQIRATDAIDTSLTAHIVAPVYVENDFSSMESIESNNIRATDAIDTSITAASVSPIYVENDSSSMESIENKQSNETDAMNSSLTAVSVSPIYIENDSSTEDPTSPSSTPLKTDSEDSPWNHYSVRINRYSHKYVRNIGPDKFMDDLLCAIIYSEDSEWANMINDALYSAQYSWIDEKISEKYYPYDLALYCASDRYLSLQTIIYNAQRENFENQIREAYTIDLRTGKQVLLDDLIEIDSRFIEALKSSEILVDFGENEFNGGAAGAKVWLSNISDERLMEMLQECSKTPSDYPDEDNYSYLFFKSTFYLVNGRIVLVLVEHEYSYRDITVNIDKIEEFLKVPKW